MDQFEKILGKQKLMRIFIGESDTFHGVPLYKAIVNFCRERKIAGATVIRGIYGYGGSSILKSSRTLALSQDLPIIIEIVDTMEKIEAIMPDIENMMFDAKGLITLELAEVIRHISNK